MKETNLKQKILDCGLKQSWVAKKLGITYQCFLNKLNSKTEFKISEALTLARILNFSREDWDKCFSYRVDNLSTKGD